MHAQVTQQNVCAQARIRVRHGEAAESQNVCAQARINVCAQARIARICVRHREAAESAMRGRRSRRARCGKAAAVTRGGAGQTRLAASLAAARLRRLA
jgi:hypothetical protein